MQRRRAYIYSEWFQLYGGEKFGLVWLDFASPAAVASFLQFPGIAGFLLQNLETYQFLARFAN
jgi:hypothetical protein